MPHDWLEPLVESGYIDDEGVGRLVRGFRTWMQSGGDLPLPRCFGLPANPERVRLALRDAHLRRAAACLEGTTWQRAKKLAEAVRVFQLRRWPCWWQQDCPPPQASDLDRHLFHAMRRGGGRLPQTPEMLRRVLVEGSEQESP